MDKKISRSEMTPEERRIRSKASQMLGNSEILHGSLSVRLQVCGKKNCACSRGEKHRTLVLTVRTETKTRQIYIPLGMEPMVRQWLDSDQEVRGLLAKLSQIQMTRLMTKKKKKRE